MDVARAVTEENDSCTFMRILNWVEAICQVIEQTHPR